MPCIRVTTTQTISDSDRKSIQKDFGQMIRILPGKSEQWLMIAFADQTKMCFSGDDTTPCAYVEVSILGKSDRAHFDTMTNEICKILQNTLSIEPDRVYVKYEECTHWGWNGGNF